ncbi:uncharacterized protein PV09_07621 [Verruconis gallopava]|uniref:Translation machinery-associated protein 16 n=1 Tax=Verruconis gallopava TaxID=253628 RepID=A0A0D2AP22_9PEZI|nr:uncharacterized protein PV09_07621 [Verruconis gallopava]KIW00864.1 hypothetical protein PV09_07621 [Verruconis gallopava]
MPVKSFSKVTKQIKEKKGGRITALHEHSRDARRLQRASAREEKLAAKITAREKANLPHLQRVSFFQSCLPEAPAQVTPYDIESIQSLIKILLSRFDDELAALKAERRPGRPPATRELAIKQQLEADSKEYESGLWIPDLRDEETLFSLRNWKGEWSGLNVMKFVRLNRKGEVRESSFPPKGQS